MPNTTSAQKAMRQSERRRAANVKKKKALKSTVKNYRKLVEAGQKEEAAKQLPAVYKALDKSAKTNLIKKNTASRLKSRLTAKLK